MEKQQFLRLIEKQLKTLPEYCTEFYLGKNLSLAAMYGYLNDISRFFTWLRETQISDAKSNREVSLDTLENLKRSDVLLYIDKLKNERNAQGKYSEATTINRNINALRSLYKYLTVEADDKDGEPYFYRNVMLKIESLPASETLNYRAQQIESKLYSGDLKHELLDFMENEYEEGLSNIAKTYYSRDKKRNIAIVALLLGSGVRVSEAANANLTDLHFDTERLDVVRKGGQRDSVPIAHWTIKYLREYVGSIEDEDKYVGRPLFTTFRKGRDGKPNRITIRTIENMVEKVTTAFGRPVTPHKFRHTLASELYAETKDEVMVAQQLGQKGTSATKLYTHVGQSVQQDAVNRIK